MKTAKDRGEVSHYTERKDNILGRNKTRLELWEEHLKDPIVALDRALKCVENCVRGFVGPRTLWREAGAGFLQSLWIRRSGRAFGFTWIRWRVRVFAQRPWSGMCQGSTGRMASSFSS